MSLASQSYDIPLRLATNDYQYEDGTVIIHVGAESFKIGRSRLAQRSPVFRELLGIRQSVSRALEEPGYQEPEMALGISLDDSESRCSPGERHIIPEPASAHTSEASVDPVGIPLPASPLLVFFEDSPGRDKTVVQASEPIILHLHNDPDDFKHYLWAIHADFIDVDEFNKEAASASKCAKLLGIASVAHMYEVTSMANHALEDALRMLDSSRFYIDKELAHRVIHTTLRWVDQPKIAARARAMLREAMRSEHIDILGVILVAEPLEDAELLGWGYYYLLRHGEKTWLTDSRVRAIDRRRLLSGAYALSKRWHTICAQYGNKTVSAGAQVPSWAIFEKINNISGWNRPSTTDIERDLFSFFKPDPWDL